MYGEAVTSPFLNTEQLKLTTMPKVKALWTLHGSYGLKNAGDEFTVTESVAKELKKQGSVEIIGGDDEETPKKEVKEKVNIKDETGPTEKKQILKPGKSK